MTLFPSGFLPRLALILTTITTALAAPPLTQIIAVKALGRSAISNHAPVRIQGIITAREPGGGWYLQQDTQGILLADSPETKVIVTGTRVIVEGMVRFSDHALRVHASRVEVIGAVPLPDAMRVLPKALKVPDHLGRRVEVEGIVVATSPIEGPGKDGQPESLVLLGTQDGPLALHVHRRSTPIRVASQIGSRIRATGVAHPITDPRGQVIDVAVIVTAADVLGNAGQASSTADSPPVVRIDEILRADHLSSRTSPVRIEGIVTAVLSPHSLFLQDETSGILVRSIFPVTAKPGEILAADGMVQVEMIASQESGREATPITFESHSTHARGRAALPTATLADPDRLNDVRLNFRRITVDGRVLAVGRFGLSPEFRLTLQCGAAVIDVLGENPGPAEALPRIRSRIRVSGVLDQRAQRDTRYQPLRLHLAQLSDVAEVTPPPRDLTRVLVWTVGGVTVLGLLALSWAFTLRRGVQRRTTELAEANSSLAVANRARADFLAHLSHEVRTPVHAMNGLLQLLARHPLTDEPMGIVRRLSMAVRSLTGLVNDALDLSKIDAGQLVLDLQPFQPNAVLDHAEGLFGPMAREKGLAWTMERLPDTPAVMLVGDLFRLQQVVSNLLSNAIKFTPSGHVRVRAWIGPPAQDRDGYTGLTLEVEDTGIGMDSETVTQLFMPYSQANPGIQRSFGGTGLGLAICRRLVDLMGGRITVDSTPGTGSRFRVDIDLARLASTAERVAGTSDHREVSQRPGGRRLEGCRILVADDHSLNLGIVETAIEQEGGCALLVSNGLQAIEALQHDPTGFDAVLMDIEMPVMGGLEAIRRIRSMSAWEGLPVVACSAGLRSRQRKDSIDAGASSFVSKPFDLEHIVHALVEAIQPAPMSPEYEWDLAASRVPKAVPQADGPLPTIGGIETAEATRRFAGNRSLFLRSLGRFRAEFVTFLPLVKADLEAGRVAEVASRLHGLRGAAAMLGATELAGVVADLEALMRREGMQAPRDWERFSPLTAHLRRLLESIEAWARLDQGDTNAGSL